MKKVLLWIAASLLLSAGVVQAEDVTRNALAEELLTLMNLQEGIEKSFEIIRKMIPEQMKQSAAATGNGMSEEASAKVSAQTMKMMDKVAEEFSWDKIKGDYIAIYAETFTEEELRGLIAFYKTPIGQAFLEKQPILIQRSMEQSQKTVMKIMPQIQEMAREAATKAAPASTETEPVE